MRGNKQRSAWGSIIQEHPNRSHASNDVCGFTKPSDRVSEEDRQMKIQAALSFLTVVILLIGAWNVQSATQAAADAILGKAYFAGGCFWCMEEAFEKVEGVLSVSSGYMGGTVANPNYEDVSAGRTGHAESVEVVYDPTRVSYQKLLDAFWRNVDPITPNAQFCDHGSQYRSAVFFQTDEEKRVAEATKQAIEQSRRFKDPIVTQIVMASQFYPAEDYHQDFYKKNPVRYKFYKYNCGRAQRLEELWGKP
jgi:peptide-methionine (S)-S-oxide reductase